MLLTIVKMCLRIILYNEKIVYKADLFLPKIVIKVYIPSESQLFFMANDRIRKHVCYFIGITLMISI